MYAQTGRVQHVRGSWQGTTVDADAVMNRYVQQFEISHGVNMLSANAVYRWQSFEGGTFTPYAGAGLAYYRPHSENTVGDLSHETSYVSSGFGYQVLGGLQYRINRKWNAIAEVKFNRGTAKVDIANGQAETPLKTFHLVVGARYDF